LNNRELRAGNAEDLSCGVRAQGIALALGLQKGRVQGGADMAIHVDVVKGDLLDQETEAIVSAWNRNVIPWWLLVPQGVSEP
jgi:hypothetical protein